MSAGIRCSFVAVSIASLILHAPRIWPSDCNQNGVEDFTDVTSGASRDCNRNDVPDECDIARVNYGLAPGLLVHQEVGTSPLTVGVEDFDQDGDLDLAVGNVGRFRSLSYWTRLQDGQYAPTPGRHLEDDPRSLAAADFDGDSDLDLVLPGNAQVTFLKNEAQSFPVAATLIPEFLLTGVAAADFDADGDMDIVVSGSFAVAVYWNEGSWAFERGPSFIIGADPRGVLALDLDGDLDPDIATVNAFDSVSLLTHLGERSFSQPRNFAAGAQPFAFTAQDLDGDGDTDLATAGTDPAVLFNSGEASFPDLLAVAPGLQHSACVAVGDLDSNGTQDLVLGFGATFEGMAFVPGLGSGRFLSARRLVLGTYVTAVLARAVDVDGDGGMEVVVANFEPGNVAILMKTPAANAPDCDQNGVPDDCQLEKNDCNRNGFPDHCDLAGGISSDCNGNSIPDECDQDCNRNRLADECDIASGRSPDCNSNGSPDECDVRVPELHGFVDPTSLPADQVVQALAAFDATGEGTPDVAIARGNDLVLLEGTQGGLRESMTLLPGSAPAAAASRDFDGDGHDDLAIATSEPAGIRLLLNPTGRKLELAAPLPLDSPATAMDSSDLDGDGRLDLVVVERKPERAVIILGGEGGALRDGGSIDVPGFPSFLRTADLDGDNDSDMLVTGDVLDGFIALTNNGGGSFSELTPLLPESEPSSFALGDVDGDADLDIVSIAHHQCCLIVGFNDGSARFPNTVDPGFPDRILSLDLADFDGDGDLDIATMANDFQDEPPGLLEVYWNESDGTYRSASDHFLDRELENPSSLFAVDLDSDGQPDIVSSDNSSCFACPDLISGSIDAFINRTVPPVSLDLDHDAIPDECQGAFFHRGDVNQDASLDIADAIALLGYLFLGSDEPPCLETADVENDGRVVLSDAIVLLSFLFLGGPEPAPPGPPGARCGHDPDPRGSPTALGCESYTACP